MPREDFKAFIQNAKAEYKKIGHIECPAFPDEKIYFTKRGFNHLLRKGRELRPVHQQIRRVFLLRHAAEILKESTTFFSHRTNKDSNSIVQFWSFKKYIDGSAIFVVVCQVDSDPKKFLSIMDKKRKRPSRAPS